ncbi:MAG TPA: LptF/LptG family permease, partial [Candidatus Nitrosotenuis sp.]|nr:LptF/LptG family permease [Candidatus Nitrosotenuis sp.]
GDQLTRQRRRYMVNYHQKMALPFACLVFGLLAVPLGTRPHRTTTSIGLGICLVFILAYYVLMTLGTVLGEAGAIDPALGAWLPNAVFGAVGLLLLLATSRK